MEVYKLQNQSFPVRIKFNDTIQCLTVEAGKELAKKLYEVTEQKIIRADLVDRLKPHLRHLPDCNTFRQDWNGGIPGQCTCGLAELLVEMG